MKIKFTFPVFPYEVGLIYELPEKKAQKYIDAGLAIAVEEKVKVKEVKHGDG